MKARVSFATEMGNEIAVIKMKKTKNRPQTNDVKDKIVKPLSGN